MDKAERMQRTQNVIKRRWKILTNRIIPFGGETREEAINNIRCTPHKFHKYNLNCGCRRCRISHEYYKYDRPNHERETKREIEEQLASLDIE